MSQAWHFSFFFFMLHHYHTAHKMGLMAEIPDGCNEYLAAGFPLPCPACLAAAVENNKLLMKNESYVAATGVLIGCMSLSVAFLNGLVYFHWLLNEIGCL